MEKGWRVIPLTGERMHIMFITEDIKYIGVNDHEIDL